MGKIELLSPVQDYVSLQAAIQGGADAVYFGLKEFSMRKGAKNFSISDLKKVVKICHENKIKAYVAMNTIVYENELTKIKKIIKKLKEVKIDGIHAWDMAVVKEALHLKIPVQLSTQASVSNSDALKFYKKLGIKRFILARECSLEDIKKIKKTKAELEVFIHGAMCVSVSGRCFLSQEVFGKSANRGECLQPCRRKYLIKDIEERHEFELGEDYVMSPKDLCTLPFIEKLIEAGIDSFKIEGRNRSPEYVTVVTSVYRTAIDFYLKHKGERDFKKKFEHLKKQLLEELKQVYNRGFSSGFYLGKPIEEWSKVYGSKAKAKKVYIGKILHYYSKIKVAEIKLESKGLKVGDRLMVQGPTTGVLNETINSIEMDHNKITKAKKGNIVAIKLNSIVRKNDKVFTVEK